MILSVENFSLSYRSGAGVRHALRDVSLAIGAGEVLGLVGESGSGKSSLAWSIMRHLPRTAQESGRLRLGDVDLRGLDAAGLAAIRGRRIGMVFQDPSTALNPTLRLGEQVIEVLMRHRGLSRAEARDAAEEALREVELREPAALMRRFPHEASGGEKQRILIASAFATRPELILFDEPTTALDVITGARILELFARLRERTGVAALYISHDLALVSRVADRVAVLRQGAIVEQGSPGAVFRTPRHPYTRQLVAAVPRPDRRLVTDLPAPERVLAVQGVSVHYARRRLFRPAPPPATQPTSFSIRAGEILGVVGESGSGKSSLARALTGLARFEGRIEALDRAITHPRAMRRDYRRTVQIVFQHPDSSLNPRMRIGEILTRPLRLHGGSLGEIPRLLEEVRLPADYARKYPHQLSGGEKQRVAIARAFAANPALVICDEITAALDVSVQAQVIELLLELRRRHGTAYLFITHDINLIRQIAHRIAVMRAGEMVDLREAAQIGAADAHPYTQALIAASPAPVG
ncbi:ABC transporter ATP-binding protein [Roseomonas sp. GC11]|uniref:nickel ABC transporter ATP-binding protein NikE n=1 Tax=Roseomonas sp. GC11 TaxID=2950546 RepID=UPI002109575D|nr:ABC transporter ATP-binding protein [Roseomonas sp. GC11]MCQ4160065.1 ABC transporter ATP-binding protein [Roseomonas sp. GC11]